MPVELDLFATLEAPVCARVPSRIPRRRKVEHVLLRSIGSALTEKLQEQPDSHLQWVAVVGEVGARAVPREWRYNDSLIQVGIVNGNGEGCLVYVHAQGDRYQPDVLKALFRIKLLCKPSEAFAEAKLIYEFFESPEFLEMTAQVRRYRKAIAT